MRLKRFVQPQDPRRKNGPLVVVKPDPGLWREALFLAGGDARRLRVEPDGSVTVLNQPIRRR